MEIWSALVGNIFYIVDNAASAICLNKNLSLPATLALRSISVGIADTIAFQMGAQTADTIKLKKCSKCHKRKENLYGAIEAGVLAVSYTIGDYIGKTISDTCQVEDENTRETISSLCIFTSTTLTVGLKYFLSKVCTNKITR